MLLDQNNVFCLSATDLSKHLGCRHTTDLDASALTGVIQRPDWYNALVAVLQKRGLQHEAAYLAHLDGRGLTVSKRTDDIVGQAALEWTVDAMRSGSDVIVQASLRNASWHGFADALLKTAAPSVLGNWSYEIVDTKLARETRGGTILQISMYSDLLSELQGILPERMYVVTPGSNFEPEVFRTTDYTAYYRFVKHRLERAVQAEFDLRVPDPVDQCEICQWWPRCNGERRAQDHLSFVAGITKIQMSEFRRRGVLNLAGLAELPLPLEFKPERGSIESYIKAREQARAQLVSRDRNRPFFEALRPEPGRGLARLPAPSTGDMFFDLESDPFVSPDGLEYLFGFVSSSDTGEPEYHSMWAFDGKEERRAFETFVDTVMQQRERYPDMHVYHFSPYEPGALKRLMGRYASREEEIDRILRSGLLIDLHLILKQGVRVGIERYALKEMESVHGFTRETDLRDARTSLRRLEFALEMDDTEGLEPDVLTTVEAYNREDCLSTRQLRDWLEGVRQLQIDDGQDIPRPPLQSGDPSEEVDAKRTVSLDLMEGLLEKIPEDATDRNDEQQARWLLAHMMEWHRREDKASWWEYFRLCDLNDEQLLEERNAVSGLTFVARIGGTPKCPIDRYAFPAQDTQIRREAKLKTAERDLGSIVAINRVERTVDIKKTQAMANEHPTSAFVHDTVSSKELVGSLHRIADWVIANGVDAPGRYRAGRDILLRKPPRRLAGTPELYDSALDIVSEARRLVLELDCGVLPVQGPPGSGKTHTAARMICDLIKQGKRVGITAVSHKVIRKLLTEVLEAAEAERIPVECIEKVKDKSEDLPAHIIETTKNERVLTALQSGEVQIAGATAWLWARDEFSEAVDVLFVDEAGQMSLADVLALSPGGRNLVLLGDPQQLEQPLQGTHPPGVAVSALQHVLRDHETMPAGAGLFLPHTWRLAPAISQFTSELFYENRLKSRTGLERQQIQGPTKFAGAGLWLVPVLHEGNQNESPEETEAVARIFNDLLQAGVQWTDLHSVSRPLTMQDILIVAPYNAQVFSLSERLPGANVGTVDKFQGQQAAAVIYSMATSSREDAPRGMEFLYNTHRFNVATSRARCVCIVVASPKLFEPECHTPRQMRLANALCRYGELSKTVDADGIGKSNSLAAGT